MVMQMLFRGARLESQVTVQRTSDKWQLFIRQVATLQLDVVPANGGDPDLAHRQRLDPLLAPPIEYHQDGTLPEERTAQHIILEQQNFSPIDDIHYRVMKNGTLHLISPVEDHQKLFQEAHVGKFGGHLREHQLCSRYW